MRSIVVFICLLSSLPTLSQTESYGLSIAGNQSPFTSENYAPSWGYQIGFYGSFHIRDYQCIVSPSFSFLKAQHNSAPKNLQNNFAELPLMLQLHFGKNQAVTLRPGVNIAYNTKNSLLSLDGSKTNGQSESLFTIDKPWQFGYMLELAFASSKLSSPYISYQNTFSPGRFNEQNGSIPLGRINVGIRFNINQLESKSDYEEKQNAIELQRDYAQKAKTSYFLFAMRNKELELKKLSFGEDTTTMMEEVDLFNNICTNTLDSAFSFKYLTFDQQYLDTLLQGNLTYVFTENVAQKLKKEGYFIIIFGDYFLDESDLVRTGLYVFDENMNLITSPFPSFVNYPNITRRMFQPYSIQEMILKFYNRLNEHQLEYGY